MKTASYYLRHNEQKTTNEMQYNFRGNCNSGSPIQPLTGLNVTQPPW